MKIKIIRNRVIHGDIDARKGDVIDVSDALAAQLIKSKAAEAVAAKPTK